VVLYGGRNDLHSFATLPLGSEVVRSTLIHIADNVLLPGLWEVAVVYCSIPWEVLICGTKHVGARNECLPMVGFIDKAPPHSYACQWGIILLIGPALLLYSVGDLTVRLCHDTKMVALA
jgi:hypothetical protein